MLSGVFLTNLEVFGNVVKHCLECYDTSSKSKLRFPSSKLDDQLIVDEFEKQSHQT